MKKQKERTHLYPREGGITKNDCSLWLAIVVMRRVFLAVLSNSRKRDWSTRSKIPIRNSIARTARNISQVSLRTETGDVDVIVKLGLVEPAKPMAFDSNYF